MGILLTCTLAIIFRAFLFEPFHIPSSSMKPNLLIGDYVFVNKMVYGYGRYSVPFHPKFITGHFLQKLPKRGDIVVFVPPKDEKSYYVKRVIGLPGDVIEIKAHKIFVNGNELQLTETGVFEDFIEVAGKIKFNKFIEQNIDQKKYEILYFDDSPSLANEVYRVPEDSMFLMGDNRDNSMDSRFSDVGFIPVNNLVGKVSFIGFSINEKGEKSTDMLDRVMNFIRFKRIFNFVT
jgi:signal peptidase I